MSRKTKKSVAIIVAHPDDETLWAGGSILSHPVWEPFIVCLCRASDRDRAPRFYKALKVYKSAGDMGDVDDGPDQKPLNIKRVEQAILELLPRKHFDLIISHNPSGEYTRHRRHEEVSEAVIQLWHAGILSTNKLWTFAYEDGHKQYYPRAVKNASIFTKLSPKIMKRKYRVITKIYGFAIDSWEAHAIPSEEAFWVFTNPLDAKQWLDQGGTTP